MARTINKLSDLAVKHAKARGLYGDGGGLYLQVGPTGGKSWLFRYMIDGRARAHGLGPVQTISLKEARQRALDCRKQVLDGIDPKAEKDSVRAARRAEVRKLHTFKECAEAYMRANSAAWKNDKHASQWRSTLETYVYPEIGQLPVGQIDVGMVLRVLEKDGLWTVKNETASRVRGRIETVLDYAKARKFRDGENPAAWKGNLDHILPARRSVQKVEHHAALPYDEIGGFMRDLREMAGVAARGLEFAILTACRTGEVIGARWSEVDLDRRIWTIPAERMKAGREHRVPLSEPTLSILREMSQLRIGEFVFPGGKIDKPLSNMAFLTLLRRMKRTDVTAHGFRSTFRDWAAERTSYPAEVAEMALAHSVGDKVEAAYRRGDLFEKRDRIMAEWATVCDRPELKSGTVTSLRRA
jgi:integrase